jgi:NAD(P)-dependent dehydrogenase (short-subunit alcohol dehydrogenase family)
MKILIIGGTRFFGYHIAQRLVHDGHEVSLRWYIEEYKGDPPGNYIVMDKEMEVIRRYKEAIKAL